ncbi:MAG: hypothetical protein ACYC56_05250 [Candidatus Aquicultor sp.]
MGVLVVAEIERRGPELVAYVVVEKSVALSGPDRILPHISDKRRQVANFEARQGHPPVGRAV